MREDINPARISWLKAGLGPVIIMVVYLKIKMNILLEFETAQIAQIQTFFLVVVFLSFCLFVFCHFWFSDQIRHTKVVFKNDNKYREQEDFNLADLILELALSFSQDIILKQRLGSNFNCELIHLQLTLSLRVCVSGTSSLHLSFFIWFYDEGPWTEGDFLSASLGHLYFSYTLLFLKLRAMVNENLMSRPFSCPRQGGPSGRWGWCSCWSAPPRRGTHARSGCSSPPGRSLSPSRTSSAGWSTVWGLAPRCGNRRTGLAGSPGRSWTWISPTFWGLFCLRLYLISLLFT